MKFSKWSIVSEKEVHDEYILFETEDGKIAVEIERKKYVNPGEDFYNEYSYDELSEEEKDAFVYPVERKKVKW